MAGEEWQFAGVVVAAAIGGSGAIGLLSGGVELSRRARLRKAIERDTDLAARLEPSSDEVKALRHARRLDVLRLASLSVVGLPGAISRTLGGLLVTFFIYFALIWIVFAYGEELFGLDLNGLRGRNWTGVFLLLVAFTVSYGGLVAWLLDQRLRQRRLQYVYAVDEGMDERTAAAAYGSVRRDVTKIAVERYRSAADEPEPFALLRETDAPPAAAKDTLSPRHFWWRGGAKDR